MAVSNDHVLAALFAGFSIGFGWFTVWQAIQQTRRTEDPWRSAYVYMVWRAIVCNIPIALLGWLLRDGVLSPSLMVLFMLLFFWMFETQLQPQIIINRIGVIAESQRKVGRVRWGAVAFVGLINVSVFVIWIPSHIQPQFGDGKALDLFVKINKLYDRVPKVLILLLDVGLNWWFVSVAKQRLVKEDQLDEYKPLVKFTNWMMLISILMDVGLIALISLPNEMVYIQFHPCAYLVKLHVEMTMASLVTRLVQDQDADDFTKAGEDRYNGHLSSPSQRAHTTHHNYLEGPQLPIPQLSVIPQLSDAKDIETVVEAVSNTVIATTNTAKPDPNASSSGGNNNNDYPTTTSQAKKEAAVVASNTRHIPPSSRRHLRLSRSLADIVQPPRYESSPFQHGLAHQHSHATLTSTKDSSSIGLPRQSHSHSRTFSRAPSSTISWNFAPSSLGVAAASPSLPHPNYHKYKNSFTYNNNTSRRTTAHTHKSQQPPSPLSSGSVVAGLGWTRFGYPDDEVVSLVGEESSGDAPAPAPAPAEHAHAGREGNQQSPPEMQQQQQQRFEEDWERSGTPVPFVGPSPTPTGSRRDWGKQEQGQGQEQKKSPQMQQLYEERIPRSTTSRSATSGRSAATSGRNPPPTGSRRPSVTR
ncbi:hypothetical protein PG984_000224 [Apiospora sp. TS-2023a]